VPLPTTGIFIGMSLIWAWLSDGPFKGRRYPFIYAGAVVPVGRHQSLRFHIIAWLIDNPQFIFNMALLKMPLYSNIEGRKIVYWLENIGVS
jgi:hypothetical protein